MKDKIQALRNSIKNLMTADHLGIRTQVKLASPIDDKKVIISSAYLTEQE